VYLTLYGTGFRAQKSPTATIGGRTVPVLYAGVQPSFPGLDQVNLELPTALRGAGEVEILFTADDLRANSVWINVR
jgi:uncharacterized protein (TIGR03437 family)